MATAGTGEPRFWPRSGLRRGLAPEAPTENFFATLKKEMVYRTRLETREQARGAIFRWIEVWYNRKRRHSTLGYISPEAFERKHQYQSAEAIAAQAAFLSEASRDVSGAYYAATA